MAAVVNMRVLKRSRTGPFVGDIFALQILPEAYHFGRVISLKASGGGFGNSVLLYIYRATSLDKHRIPELRKDDLLVAPIMTNRRPWTMGYFETVDNRRLTRKDVLRVHCFYSHFWRVYRNERGRRLLRRREPCGINALHSYRTIDDEISKALGIPLAPEDEADARGAARGELDVETPSECRHRGQG